MLANSLIIIISLAIALFTLLIISIYHIVKLHKLNQRFNYLMINQENIEKALLQEQQNLYQFHKESIQLANHSATQLQQTLHEQQKTLLTTLAENRLQLQASFNSLKEHIQANFERHQQASDRRQLESLKLSQESIQKSIQDVRHQIVLTLSSHTETLNKQTDKLTKEVQSQLNTISGQVEKRLTEGFEKTTATFSDVLKRLALIDEAQKRITELSSNVVSLQEVLSDKRSRGAFGEVQLTNLIRNMLPENVFALQYNLSNSKRADCILFLPEPTGHIVIDAKFPLENYRKLVDLELGDADKKVAEQQFRQDIKKHISDIAEKYIIPGETADGAVMFIPAEAVFAEIHAHYPELVEFAHKSRVWLASPTTMMAILTTARAVLKDADTRKQVHVIQEHLSYLAKDFSRFEKRMDNLARHINQANEDVVAVNTSAKKITSRFQKIERVELEPEETQELEMLDAQTE